MNIKTTSTSRTNAFGFICNPKPSKPALSPKELLQQDLSWSCPSFTQHYPNYGNTSYIQNFTSVLLGIIKQSSDVISGDVGEAAPANIEIMFIWTRTKTLRSWLGFIKSQRRLWEHQYTTDKKNTKKMLSNGLKLQNWLFTNWRWWCQLPLFLHYLTTPRPLCWSVILLEGEYEQYSCSKGNP